MSTAERLTGDAAMVLATLIYMTLGTMLAGFLPAFLLGLGVAAIIIWRTPRQ